MPSSDGKRIDALDFTHKIPGVPPTATRGAPDESPFSDIAPSLART
jgi:hypothetical protein